MTHKSYLIIIAILVGIIFLLSQCNKTECSDDIEKVIVTHTDTIQGDTVFRAIETIKPVYIYRDTGSIRNKLVNVDTSAILIDFFSQYFYSDTITDDSTFIAVINDTVTENRIYSRELYVKNIKPTTIVPNLVIEEKPKKNMRLYVGGTIGSTSTNFYAITGNIGLRARNDNYYMASYNFIGQSPNVGITMMWPVKFHRK